MPSWRAIASAVTAWSPVIIRTWMPAAWAIAMAALRLGPRRVDDADERQQRQVVRSAAAGRASGSNVAGSKSRCAVAMTRRPCAPSRSFSARYGVADLVDGTSSPSGPMGVAGAGEELVRRALDVAADDVLAASRPVIRWNVAMNL